MAGRRLLELLGGLEAQVEENGTASRWRLAGTTWRAVVVVDPQRWLGLEFEARDPTTGRSVTYDLDTDLYDISQDGQQEFAVDVERDIVEFLDNLLAGRVLRSRDGSELAFPLDGAWVRVVRGRFVTSTSSRPLRPGGDLVPVT